MESKLLNVDGKIIEKSSVSKSDIDAVKTFVQDARADRKFAPDNAHIARIPEFVVNEILRKHKINLLTLSRADTETRARFMTILRSEYPHLIIRS